MMLGQLKFSATACPQSGDLSDVSVDKISEEGSSGDGFFKGPVCNILGGLIVEASPNSNQPLR